MHFKYCAILVVVVVAFQFSFQKIIKHGKRHKVYRVYKGHERYEVGLSVMMTNFSHQVFCSGSLINPKFILTAARCLKFMTSMKIFVGTKKLFHHEPCTPSAKFKQAILHERFNYYQKSYDIALVEIYKSLPLSNQIEFVELSTVSDSNLLEGKFGRVTGFAKSVSEYNEDNTDLTELKVRLLSIDKWHTQKELDSNQLNGYSDIGGEPYGGALGAPLMLKDTNIQIGIVSFNDFRYDETGKHKSNYTNVYTNVGSYLDWIMEKSRLY